MKRLFRISFVLLALVLLGTFGLTVRTPGRQAQWLAEYEEAKHYLVTADANFDWVVHKKGIDLVALDRATRDEVASSWTSMGAAWTVRGFVWKFADGHTWARIRPNLWWRGMKGQGHIAPGTHPAPGTQHPAFVSALSAGEACGLADLDVNARPEGWTLPFADTPGAELVPDDEFPSVMITIADGRKVGILRIAKFGHEHFGPSCARAWEELQREWATAACDEGCRWVLVARTMQNGAARAAEVANELQRRGAVAVVVDITGNGGGSEFADAVARALTATPLRYAPGGFIRHPHRVAALREEREAILGDTGRASPAQRAVMDRVVARIDSLTLEAQRDCHRDTVWSGAPALCSNTVITPPYIDYAPPRTFDGLENAWALWAPSWHAGREGIYRGPLLILQDHASASASEEFAARLRDNGAARIIGERSFGAGCGYTNGGTRLELEALGLLIRAPDCQRLRMDGANETEGIGADVEAGWEARDTPGVRVEKAVAAIGRALPP
jgi:hypothetical protein